MHPHSGGLPPAGYSDAEHDTGYDVELNAHLFASRQYARPPENPSFPGAYV